MTTDYAVYQITCSHDTDGPSFEMTLANLLVKQRFETRVSVTVNAIIHSVCLYTKDPKEQTAEEYFKNGAITEPSALIIVSINPNHAASRDGVPAVREARPYVEWLAEQLRLRYKQHVVPFSALSPADSVGAAFMRIVAEAK